PLLRSAAYHDAEPADRRAAHRALAVHEDDTRSAWHLARAAVSPDETVAVRLEAEAIRARERSGYAAAGDAYEDASLLTPTPRRRAARLIEAARCFETGGFPDHATALLEQATAQVADDERLMVEVDHVRAQAEMGRGNFIAAADLLLKAAATIEPLD